MSDDAPRVQQGDDPLKPSRDTDWDNGHPVNIRLSVPLVFWKFYVTIVGGPERRSGERRRAERAQHRLDKLGNVIFMGYFGVIVLLALSAVIIGAGMFLIGQVFDIGIILR